MVVVKLIEGLSWSNIVGFWVGSHIRDCFVAINIATKSPIGTWRRKKCSQLVPNHFGKKAIQR